MLRSFFFIKIFAALAVLGHPAFAGGLVISQSGLQDLNGEASKPLMLRNDGSGIAYAQVRVFPSIEAFHAGQRPSQKVRVAPGQVRLAPGDQTDVDLTWVAGAVPRSKTCLTAVVDEAPPPITGQLGGSDNTVRSGIALAVRHIMPVCYGQ